VLLGFVFLAVVIESFARRRARYHQISSRVQPVRRQRMGPVAAALAVVLCVAPLLAGFVIPSGIFIHMALTTGDAQALVVVLEYGRNSLLLASIACVVAVTLALLVAYARRLDKGPATLAAARVAGLGYALPGTVLGLGLLIPLTFLDHRINDLTRWLFGTTVGLVLTGTIVAMVLGYQTRFMGVALSLVESALGRVKPSLDDAARTLGSGRLRIVWRVHLPILRVSIVAAALLVFVDVVKELPATLMLRPFNFETLAVRTYQLASDERLEQAAFSALLIILLGLIPVMVLTILLIPRSRTKRYP